MHVAEAGPGGGPLLLLLHGFPEHWRAWRDYFAPLARRNTSDMKWKKFFTRLICRDASYTLCTAPSCGECSDYDNCFTEETGESLLAHLRKSAETAA